MPSAIDITKPIYGTPTTQSVRDNFHIARDEISSLQGVLSSFVNRSGDTMTGILTLSGPPVNLNDAATLDWTLKQLHSTINTLVYVGDYDGAADLILTSGQPQFVVGQPLPAPSPVTSQYYFTVKTSRTPGVGNQPPEGVTAGTWLISNGTHWSSFAITSPGVTAQGVPVSPPVPNVPGTNVYDALTSIGANFLLKAGGTMTGDLILNRNPVVPMGAATKQYIDTLIAGIGSPNEAPNDGFGYARQSQAWSNLPVFGRVKIDQNAWGHLTLNSTTASNTGNQIIGMKDNLARWILHLGGASGVDFELFRYDDSGTMFDGVSTFVINRLNGTITTRHHLTLDPLVSTTAWIFGRGPNNPTDGTSDTLNIYCRSGISSSVIGLRGPTYPGNPNGFEIYTGATAYHWTFDQNGVLTTPGNIYIPDTKLISIGGASIYYGGGNWVFTGNNDWRMWWSSSNGAWRWEGYPNLDLKMQLDGNGNLWAKSSLRVGSGVIYGRLHASNYFEFNWDGNLHAYVNTSYIGPLALQTWVNTNFATYNWVNTYFYTATTTDSRYLYKWGDTCTGSLGVNGRLTVDNIMNISGMFRVGNNDAYYLGRDGNDAVWRFVENNVTNFAVQPSGNVIARGGLYGGNTNYGLYNDSSGNVFQQYTPNWYWGWASLDGTLQWVASGGVFWVFRTSDWWSYNNRGPVAGHGWIDLSDIRTKTNVSLMEDIGLKEIMRINPIRFNRIIMKDNIKQTTDIGFSAQDVKEIIPEAVAIFGVELPDGTGGQESDNPTLGIATTTLLAALVNAVKELNNEIQMLKGRLT